MVRVVDTFHSVIDEMTNVTNLKLVDWLDVVLATVPGYPAAVRVWNRTGRSSPGGYAENRGTYQVRGRVRTGPRFHFTVPTTLAPIKYLSSDGIMT